MVNRVKKRSLVFGVGINDADYNTSITKSYTQSDGKRTKKIVWRCPFYTRWYNMLRRAYNPNLHNDRPTYIDCSVNNDWLTFSNFKTWMEQQDWEGKELDKDLLFPDNKEYGPDTSIFVSKEVNMFVVELSSRRGKWPIGVSYNKNAKKFQASLKMNGTSIYLGYYDTPKEAHKAWLSCKLKKAHILAAQQTDERIAKALIDRYENYIKYFEERK